MRIAVRKRLCPVCGPKFGPQWTVSDYRGITIRCSNSWSVAIRAALAWAESTHQPATGDQVEPTQSEDK